MLSLCNLLTSPARQTTQENWTSLSRKHSRVSSEVKHTVSYECTAQSKSGIFWAPYVMSKGVQGVLAVFAVVLCVCPKLPKHSDLGLYSYTRSLPTQRGRIMHFLPRLLLFSYGSPRPWTHLINRRVWCIKRREATRAVPFFFDVQRVCVYVQECFLFFPPEVLLSLPLFQRRRRGQRNTIPFLSFKVVPTTRNLHLSVWTFELAIIVNPNCSRIFVLTREGFI